MTVWRQANKYSVPRMCFVNKLDRTGADFFRCVDMMVDRLNSTPLVLQLPIGAEGDFIGVVDLVGMRALVWRGETTMGRTTPSRRSRPTIAEQAAEYREKLLETLSDSDDVIMEKFLDEGDFTVEEIEAAIRRATLADKVNPVLLRHGVQEQGRPPCSTPSSRTCPRPSTSGHRRSLDQGRVRRDHPQPSDRAVLGPGLKIATDPHLGKLIYVRSTRAARGGDRGQLGQRPQERIGKVLPDARETICLEGKKIASSAPARSWPSWVLKAPRPGHPVRPASTRSSSSR